ncbi:hypothetical protein HBZC1_02710 [Helicobacter bizzozeronii CIII-1]|uniref:Uncharacterized protein n=1 Tax=Helicobacter bizzozeronii (strain CIII-1) TaxID=1002804 RepID=F8KR83_HELBC|nr:hypothetical protein [Helicobacter bizzozeronii]CCB79257.1 hypothetical protein HBZC1_02710 [Helicobacter bizzozeronii CIII-1]
MRKAKFLLRCDGMGVRDLEELGAHFDVLDVLQHYQDHTLDRWLDSRGYERELMLVREIDATEPLEIAYTLCGIFGVEADKESLQAILRQQEHIAQKREELKLYQDQHQALKEIILKCAPPALPLVKDYIKAYADLKEQFFNATSLEDAQAILRQLCQDYAELLEMDKRGIVDVLYSEVAFCKNYHKSKPFAFLLWLCAGVSLWNRWDVLKKSLGVRNGHVSLNMSTHYFDKFAKWQTLTIHKEDKIHVFEKAVVVRGEDSIDKTYGIYPYDLQTNTAARSSSDWKDFVAFYVDSTGGSDVNFYLLKGAVEIKNREYYFDITLTYIEIEP